MNPTASTIPSGRSLAMKERIIQFIVAALVVAAALLVWGAFSASEAADSSIYATSDGLEIRYEDGELTVTENGNEISGSRIDHQGRQIKIYDEDDRVIYRLILDRDGDVVWAQNVGPQRSGFFDSRSRLRIGVTMGNVSDALAAQLGLDADDVALISDVVDDGPADDAGLRRHDIITRIGDVNDGTLRTLRKVLKDMEEGDSLAMTVLRGGKSVDVTVKPQEMDDVASTLFGGRVFDSSFPQVLDAERLYNRALNQSGQFDFVPLPDGGNVMVLPDYSQALAPRSDDRLERLERKLRRLERLLDKLVEEQESSKDDDR